MSVTVSIDELREGPTVPSTIARLARDASITPVVMTGRSSGTVQAGRRHDA
jgi:hypothetical protein